MNILIFVILTGAFNAIAFEDAPDIGILELLGLTDGPSQAVKLNSTSLRNSASRFLRQVYSEINEEKMPKNRKVRQKRTTADDDNFITEFDRLEIEKCDNFITFSSKKKSFKKKQNVSTFFPPPLWDEYVRLYFNTKNVPSDLKLIHSTLRLYVDPAMGSKSLQEHPKNVTISIYERKSFQPNDFRGIANFRVLTSVNMTTTYKGWLEFNITRLLSKWLNYRKLRPFTFLNELLIDATTEGSRNFSPCQLGLVHPGLGDETHERNPFVIGYFNGPQLVEKMHKLRTKREVSRNQRRVQPNFLPPGRIGLHLQYAYQLPKTCERLNFTVNFKDTHMDSWVIAPKKFEAYFCGGECSFPLGSHMNATNHAIVQTLMQLKQPHLPKPCCAPTALESIHILRFLNEDNVNLVKFPESVVKECGCH